MGTTWHDATTTWWNDIEQRPRSDLRRIGASTMVVGIIGCLAATPISLAAMNISFALAILGSLLSRPPLHRFPGILVGLSFTGWCAVSLIAAWYAADWEPRNLALTWNWIALPIGAAAFHRQRIRERAAVVLCITLCLATTLAMIQASVGFDLKKSPFRIDPSHNAGLMVSGFLGYHLTFGAVCLTATCAFLGPSSSSAAVRWLGRSAGAIGVVLSAARLAMFGLIAGVATYLFLNPRWRRWALPIGAALTLIPITIIALITPEKFANFTNFRDGRIYIWEVTSTIVSENPLLGIGGQKAFQQRYADLWPTMIGSRDNLVIREPNVAHPHNNQLTMAAFHGLPAMVLNLLFVIIVFTVIWRNPSPAIRGRGLAVLVGWLVAGLFNNLMGQGESAYAGWLGLALTGALGGASPTDPDANTPTTT